MVRTEPPTGPSSGPLRAYAGPNVERGMVMPLRLSDLLADPALGAEVIAGAAGLDRRGPIRWAHISELPDPTPWLEGGELLLTTGLGVRDDPALQRSFVAGVAERGVVALGFALGVSMPAVPEAMLRACDDHDLPLFTLPYEIPFIAVTRRVAHHLFEQRDAMLHGAVALQRQVLAAVTSDGGIDEVLATISRAMPEVALLVVDFAGQPLARTDPHEVAADLDARGLWQTVPHGRGRGTASLDGRTVTWSGVSLGGSLEAMVIAVSNAALAEHESLLFEQGVAGIHLNLAREHSVRDAHRRRVDELLEEVAGGRVSSAAIERTLQRLGAKPLLRPQVLAIRTAGRAPHAVSSLVEDALVDVGTPIVGQLAGMVHAIVAADDDAAARIIHAADRRGWADLRIGRSRAKSELDALRAALRESLVAINLDRSERIVDVDELGLSGLLAGIRDDLGAGDFVAHVLGPVLDHDADDGPLITSLRAYLAHGCRPGPAADELCIHRHTLAYRLERIRELTGRDPRSGDHLMEFGLALALLDRDPR
jgi:PucR family transcriptional regulator, purine catabolism regulatory protein